MGSSPLVSLGEARRTVGTERSCEHVAVEQRVVDASEERFESLFGCAACDGSPVYGEAHVVVLCVVGGEVGYCH